MMNTEKDDCDGGDGYCRGCEKLEKRLAALEQMVHTQERARDPNAFLLRIHDTRYNNERDALFMTTRQEMVDGTEKGTMLNDAFSGRRDIPFTELPVYKIPGDHDEELFRSIILRFIQCGEDDDAMRSNMCDLDKKGLAKLKEEATFFGLPKLVDLINKVDAVRVADFISEFVDGGGNKRGIKTWKDVMTKEMTIGELEECIKRYIARYGKITHSDHFLVTMGLSTALGGGYNGKLISVVELATKMHSILYVD